MRQPSPKLVPQWVLCFCRRPIWDSIGEGEVLNEDGSCAEHCPVLVHPRNVLAHIGSADKKAAGRRYAEVGERLLRSFHRIKLERQPGAYRLGASTPKAPVHEWMMLFTLAWLRPTDREGRSCQDSLTQIQFWVGEILAKKAPSLPQGQAKNIQLNNWMKDWNEWRKDLVTG